MVVVFFVLVVVLFPGRWSRTGNTGRIGSGVIWGPPFCPPCSMDRMFQLDYEDGSLDLLVLSPIAVELLILAKYWLIGCQRAFHS